MPDPIPGEPYHRLGPADIPDGETRDFQAEGHSILVANCGGELYAIEDRCTHDDGPLAEGILFRCEIECPRHGARFDMKSGRVTALPATRPVAAYPLRVVDGHVEVQFVPSPSPRLGD